MGAKSTTKRKLETGSKTGVLNLSARKLGGFPQKLLAKEGAEFARLRALDLSKNKLRALDDEDLSVLAHLKNLNLAGNALGSARALGGLPALQTLDLSDNRLTTLPVLPAKTLKSVNVSGNALVLLDFPHAQHAGGGPSGKTFSKLKEWNASRNRIVGIAAAFFQQCAKLERLDVSRNQLEAIVSEISLLTKLQHLDVSHNRIGELAAEVGRCRALQTVLATHNQLSSVPEALLDNGMLSRLRLEGNPGLTKDIFLALEGASEFMERRTARIETQMHGGLHNTDRSVCGLD